MCHSRAATRPSVEDALRTEPALRASDTERESAANRLRDHAAAGRLDVAELEQRLGAAYSATTRGELAALLADLPGAAPARRPAVAHHDHGLHEWSGFLRVNVLLVAIWALSGAGYFWPAWVLVFWGLALVMKSGPRLLRPH
jgi:Domain of unknown function (DUF1707)